jgi:clan AA aspartic protease (TIGR02281 family)
MNTKTLLAGAALALSIAPAEATTYTQPLNLVCGAAFDLIHNQASDGKVTGALIQTQPGGQWSIGYMMRDKRFLSRNDQYFLTDVPGKGIEWQGQLKRNRSLRMIGELRYEPNDQSRFYYYEWIYDDAHGSAMVVNTKATCARVYDFKSFKAYAAVPYPNAGRAPAPVPAPAPSAPARNWVGEDSVEIYPTANYMAALVDVRLGSRPTRMMIDTGANIMSLTQDIAEELVRNGDAQWSQKHRFEMADGTSKEEWTININRIAVGRHVLNNVQASVTANGSTLLLPFSVLSNIGKFSIDTHEHKLSFGG